MKFPFQSVINSNTESRCTSETARTYNGRLFQSRMSSIEPYGH